MPFTAERVWHQCGNIPSVHLNDWPKAGKVDKDIIENMKSALKIVELGLSARAEQSIKIRQPLGMAKVSDKKLSDDYVELIKDELNVKQVKFIDGENKVELDTQITDELRLEGYLRELVRSINSMRKKQGLTPGDKVTFEYTTSSKELKKVFDKYSDGLKKSVIASKLVEKENNGEELDINGETIKIQMTKISF